jgi:hypothetical protein
MLVPRVFNRALNSLPKNKETRIDSYLIDVLGDFNCDGRALVMNVCNEGNVGTGFSHFSSDLF